MVLLLEESIDNRCSHYALLQVIKGWFAKLRTWLSEVQDIVMYLESDTKVGTEVKETPLILNVLKVH